MTKEETLLLSQQRAEAIKKRLVKAGALESSITVHAKADKAPIFSNESSNSTELNNRADIIVRKLTK